MLLKKLQYYKNFLFQYIYNIKLKLIRYLLFLIIEFIKEIYFIYYLL